MNTDVLLRLSSPYLNMWSLRWIGRSYQRSCEHTRKVQIVLRSCAVHDNGRSKVWGTWARLSWSALIAQTWQGGGDHDWWGWSVPDLKAEVLVMTYIAPSTWGMRASTGLWRGTYMQAWYGHRSKSTQKTFADIYFPSRVTFEPGICNPMDINWCEHERNQNTHQEYRNWNLFYCYVDTWGLEINNVFP